MSFNVIVKDITNEFNLRQEDVLKIAYSDIEQAINVFREEIRMAESVETLEFLRRYMWNKLFAENGVYYDLCKRSPMLKILRLNADIRYCDLLKQKKYNEQQQIIYQIIKTNEVIPQRQVVHPIIQETNNEIAHEVDDELTENVIIY